MNESETERPIGATMTASQVRKLKIAIAVMSVMLIAGFILLLVGIYMQTQKLSQKGDAPAAASQQRTTPAGIYGTIDIPVRAGAKLEQVLIDGGNMILHLQQPGGGEVAVIELESGREIQRFRLVPRATP